MRQTTLVTVVVGIFLVVGVLILIWFSLRIEGDQARANMNTYFAEFDKVSSLQVGSPVTLAGVEIGSVRSMHFDTTQRKVVIELATSREYPIRRGDVVSVQMRSLLGSYHVNIAPGDGSEPVVPPGETLASRTAPDLTDMLSMFSGEGGGLLPSLDSNVTSLTRQIAEVITENRENLRRTTEAFAEAAPKIEALATSISAAASSFAEIARQLKSGEGTLGRLLTDDKLYDRVSEAMDNVQAITKKIRDGEGSLGKLVNEAELHGEAEKTFASFRQAADELRDVLQNNREEISKALASVGKMGDDLGKAADNLVTITEKVRKGEGTLGMLVNDKQLYDDVRNAIDQIRRTFEQTEEQSVVRTFLGVVLGAAQ